MNIKRFLPTYSKSGERYTIGDKITIWCCMIALLASGILILTNLDNMLMLACGCALAYFSSVVYSPTIINSLRRRIRDLQEEEK